MSMKAVIILCLAVFLAGCHDSSKEMEQAISPSEKYWLSPQEQVTVKSLAEKGDIAAMRKLADHYLSSDKEDEGIKWLERAGDAGDIEARRSVIDYYEHVPQPDSKKGRGAELRKRWKL